MKDIQDWAERGVQAATALTKAFEDIERTLDRVQQKIADGVPVSSARGSLTIITWKWRRRSQFDKYTAAHVNALYRACTSNVHIPFRFVCITDDPAGVECDTVETPPAITMNGEEACYRRLKMFDPEWSAQFGTDFILSLDLDCIFLGDATDVVLDAMQNDFTIMRGSTWPNGQPVAGYNGSMILLRNGARPQFWSDFDPATFGAQRAAYRMPNGRPIFGSDQAVISILSPDEKTFDARVGQYRLLRGAPGDDVRILFFAGRDQPWSVIVRRQHPALYEAWARYA